MAKEAVKFKVGDVAKNASGAHVRIVYDERDHKEASPWPLLGVIQDGAQQDVTEWYSESGDPSGVRGGRLIGLHREPRELLLQRMPTVYDGDCGAWVSVSEQDARDAGSEVIRVREVIE